MHMHSVWLLLGVECGLHARHLAVLNAPPADTWPAGHLVHFHRLLTSWQKRVMAQLLW